MKEVRVDMAPTLMKLPGYQWLYSLCRATWTEWSLITIPFPRYKIRAVEQWWGKGRAEKDPGFRADHKPSESSVNVTKKMGHREDGENPGM